MRTVDLSPMEKSQILVIGTMMGSKGLPYRRHTYQGPGVALDDLLQGTHYPFPHWLTVYSGPLLLNVLSSMTLWRFGNQGRKNET